MEEWEIATALRGARPHPLHDAIPDPLRPWLLDAHWERQRLWEIDHPVSVLPIAALRWCYALPWWRDANGAWFRVSPREVLRQPGVHVEHEQRIAHADLAFPVHVFRRHGRWVPLDGIHRLVKADVELRRRVHVVPLGPAQLARIVVRGERVRS